MARAIVVLDGGEVPEGMVAVSEDEFFNALFADPRDIMPSHMNPNFTTWETKVRTVWGWSSPGWQNPRGRKAYAVVPAVNGLAKAA